MNRGGGREYHGITDQLVHVLVGYVEVQQILDILIAAVDRLQVLEMFEVF